MTDIQITDVTNGSVQTDPSSGSQTWLGTGVFDKLVEAVNKNIELQYMEGRITGSDYANVYLGSMQAVLAQATQFVLQEKVTEAQIADINAGLLLKQQQLVNLQDELATSAKQREQIVAQTNEIVDSTIRANTQLDDQLVTSEKQRLQVDAQITGINKDNEVKTEQVLMSVFEREFIQPKNLEKLETDIDVATRQIIVTEAQSSKDILVKDAQIAQTITQTTEIADSTTRANVQLQDQVATSVKQRESMDKDIQLKENQDLLTLANIGQTKAQTDIAITLAAKDVDLKEAQYRQTERQTDDIIKGIEVKDSQIVSMGIDDDVKIARLEDDLLTAVKQRVILDEQKETADKEQLLLDGQKEKIDADIRIVKQQFVGRVK